MPELNSTWTIAVVYALAASFFVGYQTCRRNVQIKREQQAQHLYQRAKSLVELNDFLGAIPIVGGANELIGDNINGYHLLGICYRELSEHEKASMAYQYAASFANRIDSPDATLNYFNAALSSLKVGHWQGVFDLSQRGIVCSERNPAGRFCDGRDLELHLRVMKVLSSVLRIKGVQGFKDAVQDAQWILQNSKEEKLVSLAKSYLGAEALFQELAEEILKQEITPESMWRNSTLN